MSTEIREKRHYFRHPIHYPIRVEVVALASPMPDKSQCEDLSEKGLCFYWNEGLMEGTLIQIAIPIGKRVFNLKARVIHSEKDVKSESYKIGVSFEDETSAFQAKIAEEILRIQEYRQAISRALGIEVSEKEAAEKWIKKFSAQFSHLF